MKLVAWLGWMASTVATLALLGGCEEVHSAPPAGAAADAAALDAGDGGEAGKATGGQGGHAGDAGQAGSGEGGAAGSAAGAGGFAGGGQAGSGAGGVAGSAGAAGQASVHHGEATYYDATGGGNCSFDPSPHDLMVAAMNGIDYDGSNICGACIRVDGPQGAAVVRVVDQCPGCPEGNVDLSKQAFAQIADLDQGRVNITWQQVPCDVSGPIIYRFKESSSQWWAAIQIRNSRYAIAQLEALIHGQFEPIERHDYNYFVSGSLGAGPLTLRVTDVWGHVLTDTGIPIVDGQEVPGASQFPY